MYINLKLLCDIVDNTYLHTQHTLHRNVLFWVNEIKFNIWIFKIFFSSFDLFINLKFIK